MNRYVAVIGLLCITCLSEAQLTTYLTLEAGPQWSLIRVADPGDYFKGANVNSSMAGITLGQELLPGLSLVTGIYYQSYKEGISMVDKRPGQTRWPSYTAFLVPLRAEYRVQVSEYPVSITPRLGYMFGMITDPGEPYPTTGILSAPDGTAFSYGVSHSAGEDQLHMLEAGLGVNLRIHGLWQASLNLSYLNGFKEARSYAVDYSDQSGSDQTASYATKGNTLFTTLAFNVPVSNIWQYRDYRIRKRIENTATMVEGKPTDRKGQLYLGAELGSLWRSFGITNPAVGARPLENRGMFRYANFHTGAYAGYMLSEEVGIDIGVNYQRSSTFFSLMYDHDVNYVEKLKAPLFLEVPVRIRYFYDMYKKKLYYVVYGGVSVLTHFSTGVINQGDAAFAYTSPVTGGVENAGVSYSAERTARVRPVLRVGTGVEYRLPWHFPLIATLYVNYMHGFVTSDAISVTTTLPEAPTVSQVNYNGSGWSLDLGIKIPFRIVEKRGEEGSMRGRKIEIAAGQ